MDVSWVVLTYNRRERVLDSIGKLRDTAGCDWKELIYVDNGSSDGLPKFFMEQFMPDVAILNKTNLGVAHGYNRGIAMATGEWILITGCDRTLPENWLKTLKEYTEYLPNTGVISIYAHPIEKFPERKRGPVDTINGCTIQPAMPMGAKLINRKLLKNAGFLREDFGLYGLEDVEHGYRLERYAKEMGLLTYIIPGMQAVHHGDEGINGYSGLCPHEYWKFKQEQVKDARKWELLEECRRAAFPYYNPYSTDY